MVTQESLCKKSDELLESWINGNRKHVVGTLLKIKDHAVGLYLTTRMTRYLEDHDRYIFLTLLYNRMEE